MRKLFWLGALVVAGLFWGGCREDVAGPSPVQEYAAPTADTLMKKGFSGFVGDTLSSIKAPESVSPAVKKNPESSAQRAVDQERETRSKSF